MLNSIKQRIPNLLDQIQPSSTAVLFATSIAIGAGTGLGAIFFIRLIGLIEFIFFELGTQRFGFLGRWLFVLIPALGGLLAGPIIANFAKEAKGHGVPEVMEAIAIHGGRIRPRVVVAKITASALCIGTGGSAGREGPIVQVGAAFGSTLGQWFNMSCRTAFATWWHAVRQPGSQRPLTHPSPVYFSPWRSSWGNFT